nr:unnamed protein product [Callosobruchus chinensis]
MLNIKGKNDLSARLKNAGDKLVVVDFYADWCKMVTPKFVDMENSFPEVVMAKINLDENEVVATYIGANMDKLEKIIEENQKNLS